MTRKIIDLTGKIFKDYEVIKLSEMKIRSDGGSVPYWECKCIKCGNFKYVAGKNLKDDVCCTCSKCNEGESSLNGLYLVYKNAAIKRNIPYEIDKEYFRKLTKGDCYYCGIEPKQIYGMKTSNGYCVYNGVDRIDNDLGYTEENCVSCCGRCNVGKKLSTKENFLVWVNKVYEYQNGIKKQLMVNNFNEKYLAHDFGNYKYGAIKRGLSFEITRDYFNKIVGISCYYCGNEVGTTKKCRKHIFNTNGIDRLDNSLGYTEDNCVPCCSTCNLAKNDMSEKEFYEWVNRIYWYSIGGK